MSRFSLSSTLALFQSVAAADSDATNSSTSSNSILNISSGSLSVAPTSFGTARGGGGEGGLAPPSVGATQCGGLVSDGSQLAASSSSTSLYEQQIREPFKITNFKFQQQQPNISNHLLELQREIKEEEEEIFADINSLINNRSNLYSSFEDDTDDFEDTLGGRSGVGSGGCIGNRAPHITTSNTSISCHPFSLTKSSNNNDIARHQDNAYFHEDEDQGLGNESDLIGDENTLGQHQHQSAHYLDDSDEGGASSNNNNNNNNNNSPHNGASFKYAPCNRFKTTKKYLGDDEDDEDEDEVENRRQQHENNNLDEQQSECELQEHQQQQYLELDNEQIHDQEQLETDDYQAIQRDFQHLTSNLPKPCVFFLEGNCRRSDCKYSHDLSSITCKYWIEGFCFKGEMCPFLHSFAPKGQDSGLLEDDLALAKRELNPTFVIESEADFPSLPLDAPDVTLSPDVKKDLDSSSLTKTIKNQILSSNPAVVFKTTKKKRKKG